MNFAVLPQCNLTCVFCIYLVNTKPKGINQMAHTVRLTTDHQVLFIQALIQSLDIKSREVIRDPQKLEQTRSQYEDAAEKFIQPVRITNPQNNIFTWMSDQITHTPHLRNQELGHRVQDISEVAARNRYDQYVEQPPETNFNDLFVLQ